MTGSRDEEANGTQQSPIALPTDWTTPPPGVWSPAPPGLHGQMHRIVKRSLPSPAYRVVRSGYRGIRRAAGRNPGRGRLFPDYLVIGVAKGGTTTLAAWLNEHPFVAPAAQKEVHYFDYQYTLGDDWYRTNFPTKRSRTEFAREHGRPFLTGEASPSYISHRWVPQRVAGTVPDVKLIVALRNPVDRAYSQFQMSRRAGVEPLESFEAALEAEEERLRPEHERLEADPLYYSGRIGAWSYLYRSSYAEQLERWLQLYPRDQFHFVKTEDLAASPGQTLNGIAAFLELPPSEREDYPSFHVGRYTAMPSSTRASLVEYFRPLNQRLYELIGIDFAWEEAEQPSQLAG
jgi:hypothetical protein